MSVVLSGLEKVIVEEPRVQTDVNKKVGILVGGQTVTPYNFTSSSYSNSNTTWQIVPPSNQVFLDRFIIMHFQINLTFAGTTSDGSNLLQPGKCGLASYPLSKIIQQLSVTINSTQTTVQLSQCINALERFGNYKDLFIRRLGSMKPASPDVYASYGDGTLASNNVLGTYQDSPLDGDICRGGYYMNVTSNTSTAAALTVDIYEPMVLPPFIYDQKEELGLGMLTTFVVNATMSNQNRIWRQANPGVGANPSTATISNITFGLNAAPELHCWFLTPRIVSSIPNELHYPLSQINVYSTTSVASLAPGATATVASNVIQFGSVPQKIYIYCQRSWSDIYSTTAKTIGAADGFTQITSLSCMFNNISGLLSSATGSMLYAMSVWNGLNMDLTAWKGLTKLISSSGSSTSIGLCGSIVCIDPAKDFGLESKLADGVQGQFNFQVSAMSIANQNQYETFPVDLIIIAISDGILTIMPNNAISSVGVLTEGDVLLSQPSKMDYNELVSVYGG